MLEWSDQSHDRAASGVGSGQSILVRFERSRLRTKLMASSRADEVAEILWELKRAGKIATYTHIARRAGFSAGNGGRAMDSCLKVVRRDWPHLQWWRAVKDDGTLENGSEQEAKLREAGYALEAGNGGKNIMLVAIEQHMMVWQEAAAAAPADAGDEG